MLAVEFSTQLVFVDEEGQQYPTLSGCSQYCTVEESDPLKQRFTQSDVI